jgi:hypothetical protein
LRAICGRYFHSPINDFQKTLTQLLSMHFLRRPENDTLLLDFGAIQPYPLNKSKHKAYILTKGFSPIEQYSATGMV